MTLFTLKECFTITPNALKALSYSEIRALLQEGSWEKEALFAISNATLNVLRYLEIRKLLEKRIWEKEDLFALSDTALEALSYYEIRALLLETSWKKEDLFAISDTTLEALRYPAIRRLVLAEKPLPKGIFLTQIAKQLLQSNSVNNLLKQGHLTLHDLNKPGTLSDGTISNLCYFSDLLRHKVLSFDAFLTLDESVVGMRNRVYSDEFMIIVYEKIISYDELIKFIHASGPVYEDKESEYYDNVRLFKAMYHIKTLIQGELVSMKDLIYFKDKLGHHTHRFGEASSYYNNLGRLLDRLALLTQNPSEAKQLIIDTYARINNEQNTFRGYFLKAMHQEIADISDLDAAYISLGTALIVAIGSGFLALLVSASSLGIMSLAAGLGAAIVGALLGGGVALAGFYIKACVAALIQTLFHKQPLPPDELGQGPNHLLEGDGPLKNAGKPSSEAAPNDTAIETPAAEESAKKEDPSSVNVARFFQLAQGKQARGSCSADNPVGLPNESPAPIFQH